MMLKVVEKYTGEVILVNPRYVAAIKEEAKATVIFLGKDAPPSVPSTIFTEKKATLVALEWTLLQRLGWPASSNS